MHDSLTQRSLGGLVEGTRGRRDRAADAPDLAAQRLLLLLVPLFGGCEASAADSAAPMLVMSVQ